MTETAWEALAPDDPRVAPRPDDRDLARQQVAAAVLPAALDGVRDRVLALCDGPDDPLDRRSLPDHLTASAVVVAPGRGALLLRHRKLGRWFQPGGHVDGDGNLLAAACREAAEETGLAGLRPVLPAVDLDVHDVAYPDGSFHVHHDLRFLLLARADAVVAHNDESTGATWVTGDADLDAVDADASTRRLVHRGLAVARELGE
ncbi:NUDIX domain-containing protein [Iamia sp. SCSIO 61187]|uniref:NUDIX domain-containing protein n=1 Tax=Iamia sp. SCSIO 61187 TaxID=2722752 RepID=UPI001C62FCC6|nr:NUDIX domain-containing protein [Iamia sp. SCSIO 61187]QYG93163.1 NUDIX domain-containing protein [Iamia sp. SCSIO 61187]